MNIDELIVNATIVDGTGADPFFGNVGILGERLIGPILGTPPAPLRTTDARGMILAPGFIDVHSHGDLIHPMPEELRRGLVLGRLAQGITTEIIGNCGLGACPVFGAAAKIVPSINSWMTPPGSRWEWESVSSFLEILERRPLSCNVGMLAAHGPLRISAMGLSPGFPAREHINSMSQWLEEALDCGAFGLSTGLIYPPGMFSETQELIHLARIVSRRGRILTSHIRGSSETLLEAVEELLAIGREAGARVHHSHNEAVGREHWWKVERVLEREEMAARDGIAVSFDMFPYTAAATMMLAIYPPWSLEGGVERLLERLRHSSLREQIRRDIETLAPVWPPWEPGRWPHNLVRAVGWQNIYVGSCGKPKNSEYEHLNLVELGERMGKSPFDAVSDLMLLDGGMVSQLIFDVSGDEKDEKNIERLLSHRMGILATDANDFGKGLPHPAAYGAFPRILARFARDKHVCSISDAIRKMSGRPAELFGISQRGVIREGYFADLVLIDYERLADRATFREPRRLAEGMERVYVNGRLAVERGQWRDASAGRLLRCP